MTVSGDTDFEAYQPGSVRPFVQFGLPLFVSESKFCAYVPLLNKICPRAAPAEKNPAANATSKTQNSFIGKYRRFIRRF